MSLPALLPRHVDECTNPTLVTLCEGSFQVPIAVKLEAEPSYTTWCLKQQMIGNAIHQKTMILHCIVQVLLFSSAQRGQEVGRRGLSRIAWGHMRTYGNLGGLEHRMRAKYYTMVNNYAMNRYIVHTGLALFLSIT